MELNNIWLNFTIVWSAPLGDFVLINGQNDWLYNFVTYSCMKDSHQLIFCTSHGEQKLTAFIQYPFSVLKTIVLKLFCVVLPFPLICSFPEFFVCTIWKRNWFVLDWWISSKLFLHFGISGQLFLTSIFEIDHVWKIMFERNSSTQFFYRISPGRQKLTSIFEVVIYFFHSLSFRVSQKTIDLKIWYGWKRDWYVFFVLFSWIDETIKTFFALRYLWSDFSD